MSFIISFIKKLFSKNSEEIIRRLPIDKIFQNPYQPRRIFNKGAMEQLKKSIKEYGMLVPIMVRKVERGYELACGERRVRACRELGLRTIPAVVKRLDTPQMVELALIENVVRADLVLLEEAEAYERLRKEFSVHSEDEIAERMGLSRESMQKYKRLSTLPMILKKAILSELITEEHAICLTQIKDEEKLLEFLGKTIEDKLSPEKLQEMIASSESNIK